MSAPAGSRTPQPASPAPSRRPRRWLHLLAVASLAAAAAAQAAPPPKAAQTPQAGADDKTQTFEERVVVREIEVIVEIPSMLRESRRKNLGPQDFQVLEDGATRQVVKASPVTASEAAPWHMVLYFDKVLADPSTIFFTANTLAQRADRLTSLGTVDVVVADPNPHIVLETREPKELEQALVNVAAVAERQRGEGRPAAAGGAGAGKNGGAADGPGVAAVKVQQDRLVRLVADFPSGGPHGLVMVADGFDTSASGATPTSATEAVAEEPARTLAAYGWVTLAAPIRKQRVDGVEHREMTDLERMRQASSGQQAPGSNAPPEIGPQVAPRTKLNYDAVIDLFVEPSSASLNAMAAATGGTVVGLPEQLNGALDNLAKRWHLFYLAPDPEDGRPRPVEVRMTPEGNILRTPVWRRSSTPPEVAAARLREFLAGSRDHGTLTVGATSRGAHSIRVSLGAFTPPAGNPAGPFRVSYAFPGTDAAVPPIEHRLLTSSDLSEKGWTADLSIDVPPGAHRVAVEVEDLAHEIWGVTLVDLGSSGAAAGRR